MIRQALANAGLCPSDVDVVEAHGTGTTLGDPIEAEAILATYGQNRPTPLWLGSIKSNIGHTQAAAGVAGIIKIIQAMRHATLPRTLHINQPSQHVDWTTGNVQLLTENHDWPTSDHPRRAGVSSFGISGTNAHIILEQPPAAEVNESDGDTSPVAWMLSAKTEPALRDQAGRLLRHLGTDPDPTAVARALGTRAVFPHRAGVVGENLDDLRAGLAALGGGTPDASLSQGTETPGKTVFVFPGHGAQWPGMGLDLLESSPVFAEYLEACDTALRPYTGWSILEVLRGEPGAPEMDRVDVIQPALFALTVALARVWQAYGVQPDAVVGHSQGEVTAAHIAGALTLEDAAKIIALRGQVCLAIAGTGGMAAVPLPVEQVQADLEAYGGALSIAGVNSPRTTVVTGDLDAVNRLLSDYRQREVDAKPIPIGYASHSSHIEQLREHMLAALADIEPREPVIPVFTTAVDAEDEVRFDAAYWYDNLRNPVRFHRTIAALLESGHTRFVEASPSPVLTASIQHTAEAAGADVVAVGTLRRDRGGRAQLLTALARAHTRGIDIDWTAVHPGRRRAALPAYAFQHQRYWLQPADRGRSGADTGHAMISTATELPDESGHILTGQISLATHPWLADHAVLGTTLLPGSAFLELALRAAVEVGCERIDSLTLENPLVLDGEKAVDLHITVSAAEEQNEDRRALVIHSRPTDRTDTPWTRHATGTIGEPPRQYASKPLRPYDPKVPAPYGLEALGQFGRKGLSRCRRRGRWPSTSRTPMNG